MVAGLGDGVTEGFATPAPEAEFQGVWEAEPGTLFEEKVFFLVGPGLPIRGSSVEFILLLK
jgi:hypothetical protein